jgi:hypothetical protein
MAAQEQESYRRESGLFNIWLKPVIGALPFHKISRINLERVKKDMADSKLSPRSIQYAPAVDRQVVTPLYLAMPAFFRVLQSRLWCWQVPAGCCSEAGRCLFFLDIHLFKTKSL